MNLYILDKDFAQVGMTNVYDSLIWTDRYREPGDFELYTAFNSQTLNLFIRDYYIWRADSEHTMIIEEIEIISDAEDGNKLKVSGRSLECILERRIVWKQTEVKGALNTCVKKLLTDAIINPTEPKRKIENFVYMDVTDPYITTFEMDHQYTGDTLLDVISELCEEFQMGFKIVLNDENQFVFSFYYGSDRTYYQEANTHVIFSPKFKNVVNSNYLESSAEMANVALVAGEGEGKSRKTVTIDSDEEGLDRRELFVDARGISSNTDSGTLSTTAYNNLLRSKGLEELAAARLITSFEGEMETTRLFSYKRDFFIGDIVEIQNEYGMGGIARIIEFITSISDTGIETYPTFEQFDMEEYHDLRQVRISGIFTSATAFNNLTPEEAKGTITTSSNWSTAASIQPWKAMDKNKSSYWVSGKTAVNGTQWFQYTWNRAIIPTVIFLRLGGNSNVSATPKVEIQALKSGQWTTIATAENTKKKKPWEVNIKIEDQIQTTAIRVVGTVNKKNKAFGICTMTVYGRY